MITRQIVGDLRGPIHEVWINRRGKIRNVNAGADVLVSIHAIEYELGTAGVGEDVVKDDRIQYVRAKLNRSDRLVAINLQTWPIFLLGHVKQAAIVAGKHHVDFTFLVVSNRAAHSDIGAVAGAKIDAASVDFLKGHGIDTAEETILTEGIDQIIGVISIIRFTTDDRIGEVAVLVGVDEGGNRAGILVDL